MIRMISDAFTRLCRPTVVHGINASHLSMFSSLSLLSIHRGTVMIRKQYGYMRYVRCRVLPRIPSILSSFSSPSVSRTSSLIHPPQSTTEKANRYSMSLTRYCFLHRDYLDIYINELPLSILDNVAKNFNGEDIAMSFLISSLTDGKPPLLADTWAIKSMVKLYVEKKISGGRDHKHLRDVCIDTFAQILGLKDSGSSRRLQSAKLYHQKDSNFDCGDTIREKVERYPKSERQVKHQHMLDDWHKKGNVQKEVHRLMTGAAFDAYQRGLIEKSDPWKARFHTK